MKKTILSIFVLAAIAFVSCSKERTCECTSTTTTGSTTSTSSWKDTDGHATKKQMKKAYGCYSYKATTTTTFGTLTVTSDEVQECTVK